MIPEVLDSNSYLLRDYSGFVRNLADRLPSLTQKWTDLTISEPDTIFLNNIAYINDLLSYSIDFNYLLSSVKYTANRDFLNTVCALTGSSVPFYREAYSLIIKSSLSGSPYYIPQGSVFYDSSGLCAVIVLRGAYILPNTETSIPVILGNIYNSSIPARRNSKIDAKSLINSSTLHDLENFASLNIEKNAAKVFYSFLLHKEEKYWVSRGDESLCIMSPSLAYAPYKFLGFALEADNILANASEMRLSEASGAAFFAKTKEGVRPIDINDSKIAYYESLSEIYTDINSDVFAHNLDYSLLPEIDRLALSFTNNRNSLISSSYVSYTEGYMEISSSIPLGSLMVIGYDYYSNDIGPSVLTAHDNIVRTVDFLNFASIDLELEENCTIKAFSLLIKLTLPDGRSLYLTDYNNSLIVPRGTDCAVKFSYYAKDTKTYSNLDFSAGFLVKTQQTPVKSFRESIFLSSHIRIEKSDGGIFSSKPSALLNTAENDYYLLLLTQAAASFYLMFKDKAGRALKTERLRLPANNCSPVCIGCPADSTDLLILNNEGSLVYTAKIGDQLSYLSLDESYLLGTSSLPNLVFHDAQKIYFFADDVNALQNMTVDLDGRCSYQVFRTTPNSQTPYLEYRPMPIRVNGVSLGVSGLFYLDIPAFYAEQFGTPQTVSIVSHDRVYYSTDGNYSTLNRYSSLISTDVIRNTIDLYDLPIRLAEVAEIIIKVGASVYLKPLDLSNQIIFDLIKDALSEYSEGLQINEPVSSSAILSKILHSSEYIAYVELDGRTVIDSDNVRDQVNSLGDFIVQIDIDHLDIVFKNSDILQF